MLCNTTKALPANYQPGMYDVICGRGKTCYRHPGNLHMRKVVASYVDEYSQASNKDAKSAIVSTVARDIEALGCGFVKQQHGGWHCVTFSHAREKISQAFRDLLHNRYKSSIDTRRKARQAKRKIGDEPSRPAKKLHAIASSSKSNEGPTLPMNERETPLRASSLWFDSNDMLLDFEEDAMEWLHKPEEIFSISSTSQAACSAEPIDVPLALEQRRDSHILLEAVSALEGTLLDEESACENEESFRSSILFLQKVLAKELEGSTVTEHLSPLVQQV